MISAFIELPVTAQIFLIVCVLIVVLLLLLVAAKYGLNIKKNGFSLTMGDSHPLKNKISPHQTCPNRMDAAMVFEHIRDLELRINDLRRYEKIQDQMNIVESYVQLARIRLLKVYTSLLEKKGFENPIKTDSCDTYQLILLEIKTRLIDKMRQYMRENHFETKTESEFEAYVENRSSVIINLVTETLNDLYKYEPAITRAELYKSNEKVLMEFQHMIRDCFIESRGVAISVVDKINDYQSQIKDLWSNFLILEE